MTITFYSINGGRDYLIDAEGHDWHGHTIAAAGLGRFLTMAEREDFEQILVA